jgi:hypothetical protein
MTDMRQGLCPLCSNREVIRSLPVEFTDDKEHVRMAVTHGQYLGERSAAKPFGSLSLYVCGKCGYAQWFADEPAMIPVGPAYGTESIKAQ